MTKRKFNWLDALCILLVLAIIAAAVWYFNKDEEISAAPAAKPYEVTLRFVQATTDPHDFYQVGDTLHFFTRSAELGTITAIETLDWVKADYDTKTNEYITYVDPQRKQIQLKVLVQGAVIDGEFTVNGTSFLIGETFYPQSDRTRSVMTVWDIEEVVA